MLTEAFTERWVILILPKKHTIKINYIVSGVPQGARPAGAILGAIAKQANARGPRYRLYPGSDQHRGG